MINRLSQSRDIQRVLQRGFNFQSECFKARILRSRPNLPIRFAIVVSKKVSAKATTRNYLRRKTREAFKPQVANLQGYDIVLFPRETAAKADFRTLEEEAKKCLDALR
ncbi:MAG: ribonuclease P protein component [Candidatus Berkelbacteria bacterium]|nr:ribonuclease P protein component [Candidatus Berkelbacteria bacterium]